MKKLLLAIIATISMTCAFAQGPGVKLSIGPEVGLPLGDIHDFYSFTLGGTLKLEVPVNNSNFNITFTSGFINYFAKDYNYSYSNGYSSYSGTVRADNAGFIPVKVGGKYYANPNFYVEGEVGIVANTNSSQSSTAFAYAPGIGFSLPIGGDTRKAFDIGARYEGWSKDGTVKQVALRLAYKFGL